LSRICGNFKAFFASRFSRQKFQMYGTITRPEDLAVLRDLMATGKVTPVVDRTYKLSETAEAMRYFEEGHARGKVVITVEQNEQASVGQ
jgi:NADPH:quinone reductase-like Zn-dependent oxidoreductase